MENSVIPGNIPVLKRGTQAFSFSSGTLSVAVSDFGFVCSLRSCISVDLLFCLFTLAHSGDNLCMHVCVCVCVYMTALTDCQHKSFNEKILTLLC